MAVRTGGAFDPASRIERVISAQEAGFIRAFLNAVQSVVDANTLDELETLLLQGRVEQALETLEIAGQAMGVQYGQAFSESAIDTARFLSQQALTVTVAFDQTNTRAVDAMRRNQLRIVREFTNEQRDVTRSALIDGIERGLNPREQARQFRNSIGLTRRQLASVQNYRRLLTEGRAGNLPSREALDRALRDRRFDRSILASIRDNAPLPPERVDRMVQRYTQRFLRYRSEVIARTEALRSAHEGTEEMYRQAIEAGVIDPREIVRTWVTARDERVRSSHSRLNGVTRGIGETWSGLGGELRFPGDPNAPASETVQCRCIVTTRIMALQTAEAA